MSSPAPSPDGIRPVPYAYWMLFVPALAAFSLVTSNYWMAGAISVATVSLQLLGHKLDHLHHRLETATRWLLISGAYALALLPRWPGELSDHHWLPLVLGSAVAIASATLKQSLGLGRATLSMVAIGALLIARNLVAAREFVFPMEEWLGLAAFVAILEIGRSRRYRNSSDTLDVEFSLSLGIAILASFHNNSPIFAALTVAMPIAGYLLRSHTLSKTVEDLVRFSETALPELDRTRRPARYLGGAAAALASCVTLFSFVGYLALLQVPSWTDYVKDAPYLLRSTGEKVQSIAETTELDTEPLKGLANKIRQTDSQTERTGKVNTISKDRASPNSAPATELRTAIGEGETRQSPTRKSVPAHGDKTRQNVIVLQPESPVDEAIATPDRWTASQGAIFGQSTSATGGQSESRPATPSIADPPEGPVPATEQSEQQHDNSTAFRSELRRMLAESIDLTIDLPELADHDPQPVPGFGGGIVIEETSRAASLSPSLVLTAKLDNPDAAPGRLYLRYNVLDTLTPYGFIDSRRETDFETAELGPRATPAIKGFKTSRSADTNLTITVVLGDSQTLPLPDSFESIRIAGGSQVLYHAKDRIIKAPQDQQTVTYQIAAADLDVESQEQEAASLSSEYRQKLLSVPLPPKERAYLKRRAESIGGRRTDSARFAKRIASYFAARHPYSLDFAIPPGDEHPTVRWLKEQSDGICSHYAAAFTLLARSRGIPTRVVTGFSATEYDATSGRFSAMALDAHAWIEYLDESNRWIRFETTPPASLEVLARFRNAAAERSPLAGELLVAQEEKNLDTVQPQAPAETSEATSPVSKEPIVIDYDFLAKVKTMPDLSPTQTDSLPGPQQPENEETNEETPASKPTASKIEVPSSIPDEPKAEEETATPIRGLPASAETETETRAPVSNPSSFNANTLIICLLLILALGYPIMSFAKKAKESLNTPTKQRLRAKAGQLLREVEELTRQLNLTEDPVWAEVRASLTAQRYGPATNKPLVEDLAVKVALLAKAQKKRRNV